MESVKPPAIALVVYCLTFGALTAAVSPRFLYWPSAWFLGSFAPVYQVPLPQDFEWLLMAAVMSLQPYLAYLAFRAAGPIHEVMQRTRQLVSPSVWYAFGVTLLTPIWLKPLAETFGKPAIIAAVVWWFLTAFSVLTLVGSAAAHQTEREGKEPWKFLLEALHHLGGAPGIYAARSSWPESEVIAEIAEEPPQAVGFVIVAAIVYLVIKPTN
jgi:hypothetical protein